MKASRKSVLALIGAMAMGAAMAAPSVEIVSVQQQYPWTNTVDIVYNVAGVASDTNGYFVAFTPTTQDGLPIEDINGEKTLQVALTCSTNGAVAQWFPQTNQQYTACKMTPAVYRGGSGGGNDYMIVDLETGSISYEPMATQEASNQKYNTLAYKTRYLVLRRIAAGPYTIGGVSGTANDEGANTVHEVQMGKDYYAGIFELTVAQYNRMAGVANAGTSALPLVTKDGVTWNVMRGNALSTAIPTTGPLANLNAKTGLRGFDLPTCAMWEVAARAGVQTSYLWGDSTDDARRLDYAWIQDNSSNTLHNVGEKLPNGWGLYDVHGNVAEWTLDWENRNDQATTQTSGQVPVTTTSVNRPASRWCKGGPYSWAPHGFALQASNYHSSSGLYQDRGFRIFFLER